jgi:hypothetical protein
VTGPSPVFTAVRALTTAYLAATAGTLVFVVLERDDRALVDAHVWTHALIVFGFALLLVDVAGRAARGARRAYLRLRIASVAIAAFSVVLIVIPGLLPTWMKVEQGIYALLLAAVALLAHSRGARAMFDDGSRVSDQDPARRWRRAC